jgi:hypothetical protein
LDDAFALKSRARLIVDIYLLLLPALRRDGTEAE